MEIDPIGKIQTYCDTSERICGLRFPNERVKVICKPVETEGHIESVQIEQPEAVAV